MTKRVVTKNQIDRWANPRIAALKGTDRAGERANLYIGSDAPPTLDEVAPELNHDPLRTPGEAAESFSLPQGVD